MLLEIPWTLFNLFAAWNPPNSWFVNVSMPRDINSNLHITEVYSGTSTNHCLRIKSMQMKRGMIISNIRKYAIFQLKKIKFHIASISLELYCLVICGREARYTLDISWFTIPYTCWAMVWAAFTIGLKNIFSNMRSPWLRKIIADVPIIFHPEYFNRSFAKEKLRTFINMHPLSLFLV